MGFFDGLFGAKKRSNVEVIPDRIWMSVDAKFAGLAKEAEERSNSDTVAILLVAHFADVLAHLEEIANQKAWSVPLQVVPAANLDRDLAASLQLDESATIDIIVGERHPLPSVDDHLEDFADELPCRCRFSHHLSLEDAVMKFFAGEWIASVMSNLGVAEDEAIQSNMVSRRIRKAQQKIESVTRGNAEAESAVEWLEKNCPDVGNK